MKKYNIITSSKLCIAALAWSILFIFLTSMAFAEKLDVSVTDIAAHDFPHMICRVAVNTVDGESLKGLTADHFTVLENGRPLVLKRVLPSAPGDEEKVAVVLLLDRSSSMQGARFAAAQQAIARFIAGMNGTDLVTVISFASRVDQYQPLRPAKETANTAIMQLAARGKTALNDALHAAVKEFSGVNVDRKFIILLTDGYNTTGSPSLRQGLDLAVSEGVTIYTVGVGDAADLNSLRTAAKSTGGASYTAVAPDQLTTVYRRIAANLHSAYSLEYDSPLPNRNEPSRVVKVIVHDQVGDGESQRNYLLPALNGILEREGISPPSLVIFFAGMLLILNLLLVIIYIVKHRRSRRIG